MNNPICCRQSTTILDDYFFRPIAKCWPGSSWAKPANRKKGKCRSVP